MTDELKPCPFCGGEGQISPDGEVYCKDCGCCPDWDENDPIENWNTRHESDELPEWVKEAIEDMIQCIFDIMSTNPQGYVKNCELLSKVHVLERVHSLRKPEDK